MKKSSAWWAFRSGRCALCGRGERFLVDSKKSPLRERNRRQPWFSLLWGVCVSQLSTFSRLGGSPHPFTDNAVRRAGATVTGSHPLAGVVQVGRLEGVICFTSNLQHLCRLQRAKG